MANIQNKIKSYFHNQAERFDNIYNENKTIKDKIVDRLFRKVVIDRFNLAFEICKDSKGKEVLDIGCGSGRYSIEFAKRGASKVTGLDMAENMINLAQKYASNNKIEEKVCNFIYADFLEYEFFENFDISLAMGFFDYIENPLPFLKKIKCLTREIFIASFPKKWNLRAPIRKIRLTLNNCPVYFYTKDKVDSLLKGAGFINFEIIGLSRDFFIVAKV